MTRDLQMMHSAFKRTRAIGANRRVSIHVALLTLMHGPLVKLIDSDLQIRQDSFVVNQREAARWQ